ncbi:hydroxymethylpyrimidine kinase [Aureococcus anophagefferens]|nr:hydroxymethylpyrimidine kinase [Aureococcus anophagefferens]
MPPKVLLISGSDSGGGAGLQADVKACAALGCYSANAVSALTAQNTVGVHGVFGVPPAFVLAQMDAVLDDIAPDAAKTGMLATVDVIEPSPGASPRPWRRAAWRRASSWTRSWPRRGHAPGRGAAGVLAAARDAAARLRTARGARCVVLKGAPPAALAGDAAWVGPPRAPGAAVLVDVVCGDWGTRELACNRVDTRNTHGTGCTYASAIAARLAAGLDTLDAIAAAKAYLDAALRASADLRVGTGTYGPINHAFETANWA